MIDRISKGQNVARLLYYLYGPGKSDEHTNPHLVAGWREPIADLEPPVRADGQRDFRRLAGLLNAPLEAIGRRGRAGTVWHCVLSAAPADRLLSDAEWNAIAAEFMDLMGLARRDDPAGVRWVAVRHGLSKGGIDHVHIAATLARQDGRLPDVHNDFVRARRACQAIEQQSGLTATAPADRTAAARPTRAEHERAARTGQREPPRIVLRRLVQEAAAVAVNEEDFFARLREAGALIRERRSDADPDRATGYALALPAHRARSGEPVWFGGGKLAPDLTLPRLRRRWERPRNADHAGESRADCLSPGSVRAVLRSVAWNAAEHARNDDAYFARLEAAGILVRRRYSEQDPGEVTGYALALNGHTDARGEPVWFSGGRLAGGLALPSLRDRWGTGGPAGPRAPSQAEARAMWDDIIRLTTTGAGQFGQLAATRPRAAADVAAATADALRISARTVRGAAGRDLRRAAWEFDRAAREAFGTISAPTAGGDAIRTATRLLSVLGSVYGASPVVNLVRLLDNLSALAQITAELRRLQGRSHQATAARLAAERLRDQARLGQVCAPAAVRLTGQQDTHPAATRIAPVPQLPPVRLRRPGDPPAPPRQPNGPAP